MGTDRSVIAILQYRQFNSAPLRHVRRGKIWVGLLISLAALLAGQAHSQSMLPTDQWAPCIGSTLPGGPCNSGPGGVFTQGLEADCIWGQVEGYTWDLEVAYTPVQEVGCTWARAEGCTWAQEVARILVLEAGSISAQHPKTVTTDLGARVLRAFSVPSGDKRIVLDLTEGTVGNALKDVLTGLCKHQWPGIGYLICCSICNTYSKRHI